MPGPRAVLQKMSTKESLKWDAEEDRRLELLQELYRRDTSGMRNPPTFHEWNIAQMQGKSAKRPSR